MPKYLVRGSYTAEGTKGLIMHGGGTGRRAVVQQMLQGAGGKLEALYWAFGDDDFYGIVDCPDNVTAAALSLAVNAVGHLTAKIVVLLTAEEIDEAAKKSVATPVPSRLPGQ